MGMFDAAIAFAAPIIGQGYANQQNEGMARENRAWQQDMSNTSHQREVEDLRAAGINPIFSANGGASTPSGGTGAPIQDPLSKGITSAIDAINLQNTIKQTDSLVGLQGAQTAAQQASALRDTSTAKGVELENQLKQIQMPTQKSKADFDLKQLEYDKMLQKYDNTIKRIQGAMGIGSSAVDMIKPFMKKGIQLNPGDMHIDRNGEILNERR